MKVFHKHEEQDGKRAWATVDEVVTAYSAEFRGKPLGTFPTLDEATAAISEQFRSLGLPDYV